MSPRSASCYRISLEEIGSDGTTKGRFSGTCDAYLLAVAQEDGGELRMFTYHDGPVPQRRRVCDAEPRRAHARHRRPPALTLYA